MIKFRGLRYKNVLAVGNQWITIPFTDGEKNLFMGPNGSGKSTLIEALFLVLYGKSFRKVTKGELVNTINGKDLVAEIWFDIGTNQYQIRRGIQPDFCELYINGVKKDRDASIRDYQLYIEKQILKMDEKTFRQIVVLGSSSYIPFMKLQAGHRRIVVEDLLDIGIFSFMLQVVKSMVTGINTDMIKVENDMNILISKIDILTKQKLLSEGGAATAIEDYKKIQAGLKQSVTGYMNDLEKIKSKRSDYEFTHKDVAKAQEELNKSITEENNLRFVAHTHEGELHYFKNPDNMDCPTCAQDVTPDIKKTKATELNKKVKATKANISEIITERKLHTDLLTRLEGNASRLAKIDAFTEARRAEIIRLRDQYKNIETSIKQIEDNAGKNQGELNTDLADASKDLRKVKKNIREMGTEIRRLEYISDMLKDGGIKTKIINTYLPIINKLVRKYLDIMNFSADFRFDDKFKETIKVRGRDEFSYGMFSEGEKLRVDLAILFTFRELSRMKNSAACNLIIFDEIGDSSLDADGFDAFMKVLNTDRDNQCAFIISHKPDGILSQVNNVYKFEKEQNFTVLKEKTTQEDEASLT